MRAQNANGWGGWANVKVGKTREIVDAAIAAVAGATPPRTPGGGGEEIIAGIGDTLSLLPGEK